MSVPPVPTVSTKQYFVVICPNYPKHYQLAPSGTITIFGWFDSHSHAVTVMHDLILANLIRDHILHRIVLSNHIRSTDFGLTDLETRHLNESDDYVIHQKMHFACFEPMRLYQTGVRPPYDARDHEVYRKIRRMHARKKGDYGLQVCHISSHKKCVNIP